MIKRKPYDVQNRVQHPVALALEPKLVVEIRQGVGGLEASLFAEQLLRMYERFGFKMRWSVETICLTAAFGGGVKQASVLISGCGFSLWLKHEAGVHRVQRACAKTKGRIHASTAKAAVLPAASGCHQTEAVSSDLKIENDGINWRWRSARKHYGGQNNSLATGTTACGSQRSQPKQNQTNGASKPKASCLVEVGTLGDRAEKVRAYSFIQDKTTDHKRKVVASGVNKILNGDRKLFAASPS
ncbi:MAG: PCRF domain-containing protein [Candidatus Hodgkinia cicadicola]|nr:MAG: PCRF domain-containing protein [Candidatus Hodgkinia cicadicola]